MSTPPTPPVGRPERTRRHRRWPWITVAVIGTLFVLSAIFGSPQTPTPTVDQPATTTTVPAAATPAPAGSVDAAVQPPAAQPTTVPATGLPAAVRPIPVTTSQALAPAPTNPLAYSGSCGADAYLNVDGNCVPDPTQADSPPAGATARCTDGTYSFSQHRQGTCSHHGGVAEWLS